MAQRKYVQRRPKPEHSSSRDWGQWREELEGPEADRRLAVGGARVLKILDLLQLPADLRPGDRHKVVGDLRKNFPLERALRILEFGPCAHLVPKPGERLLNGIYLAALQTPQGQTAAFEVTSPPSRIQWQAEAEGRIN